MPTRVLIVDGSSLMAWLVAQVAPPDVEVVHATSLALAEEILDRAPPDAAIFNVTPAPIEWRSLFERCSRHVPPIPFLCCSVLDGPDVVDLGISCADADYFSKSLSVAELRERVLTLVDRARGAACARTVKGPGSTP